jgi:hypothetical protein
MENLLILSINYWVTLSESLMNAHPDTCGEPGRVQQTCARPLALDNVEPMLVSAEQDGSSEAQRRPCTLHLEFSELFARETY